MKPHINLKCFESAVKEKKLGIYSIIILKDGENIYEKYWKPIERMNQRSITKSFTSAAVGFALKEKLFSLEDFVTDCFQEELPKSVSPLLGEMKLKHLLTMTTGFREPVLMGESRIELHKTEKNWVQYVLRQEIDSHPGEKFLYTNAGPYLLGVLIQRRSGESLEKYLQQRMLDPLGVPPIENYERCPMGYMFGAGSLYLNVEELSRFGQLYLQNGIWNGQQVLPEGWVDETKTPRTYSTGDNTVGYTYGYFFWIGPESKWYYCNGRFEQICMVIPEKNVVIAVNSHEERPNRLIMHEIVRNILPEL